MNFHELSDTEKSCLIELTYLRQLQLVKSLNDTQKKDLVSFRASLGEKHRGQVPSFEMDKINKRVISECGTRKRKT